LGVPEVRLVRRAAKRKTLPIITCFCNGPSCVNPIRTWFTKIAVISPFSGSAG
jgi:hypothetical protein